MDNTENLAGRGTPRNRPETENSKEDQSGLLDSLLKAFDERQADGSPADPYDDAGYAWARDAEIADAVTEDELTTIATDAESDIQALIKVAIGSGGEARDDDEIPSVSINEDDIAPSVFKELSDAAEGEENSREDKVPDLAVPSPTDELLKELTEAASAETEPVADVEPAESSDWLTDLRPEEPLAGGVEESESDNFTSSSEKEASLQLTTPEMEEVLAEEPAAETQATSFDALFEDRPAPTPMDEFTTGAENTERADVPLESLSETTVIEEIGSENVAAGAAASVAAPPLPPPEAPKPEPPPAQASAAAAPELIVSAARPKWLPPSPIDLLRGQPKRAAAAIGVGLLVGATSLGYLALNRFIPPDESGIVQTPLPLDRALRLSQSMMDERDYASALAVLDAALATAPKTDERYAEALFQRLDVKMRALPADLSRLEADAMHAVIDEAIRDGRQHRRTAEALAWKAQVYEREGNEAAARAEYRGILEDYGTAANRDDVLLRLGKLELKTDRPFEAIQIARQLIAEYPRSQLVSEARLLLGDASAAVGDADGARIAYIRIAEEEMDSPIGALAFERLGKMAIKEGQPSTAIRELQARLRSATTVEGNERVYLVLARAYRASGEPDEARNVLNELIDFFPESDVTPLAFVELSQVLSGLGMKQEALRLAERTLERFPQHVDVLQNAASLYADAGEHEKSGRAYLRAYDAGAKTARILLSAGRELELAGEALDSKSAYERVVLEYPTAPEAIEAHIGWARVALELGDLNGAHARLTEVASVTEGRPRQLPVLRALAGLYRDLGLQQEMIATYAKVAAVTDEPAPLAEAAIHLIDANAVDQGLAVARRVEISRLDPSDAYRFLQAWGRAILRGDAELAIELLQRAHDDYPSQRTAAGVETLMQAVLLRGKTAQARSILAELDTRARISGDPADRMWLASAAARYGDYLFQRSDYAAAAEAYASASAQPGQPDDAVPPTETEYWNAYQRANALFALGRLEESLALYDFVGKSAAGVARDARVRAETVRLEKRRAEGPPTPAHEAEG